MVCVVDGDPAVRDSLQYLCDSSGQPAEGFSTRASFLRMLETEARASVKYVICEAQLPDGWGLELYQHLQRRGLFLPFALLVSRNAASAVHIAAQVGIQWVWHKPLVDRTRLIDFLGQ